MVEITGENAEDFQLEPAAAQHDDGHAGDQQSAGNQVVRRIRVERDGGKAQQESCARHQLRVVLQRMPDHRRDDGQSAEAGRGRWRTRSAMNGSMLQAVSHQDGDGPAAADQGAAQSLVSLFPFGKNSADKSGQTRRHRGSARATRARKPPQACAHQKSNSNNHGGDADLGQPVGAHRLFQRHSAFLRRLMFCCGVGGAETSRAGRCTDLCRSGGIPDIGGC